ncbi:hypothetical protein D9M71_63730 [compost metagenome]
MRLEPVDAAGQPVPGDVAVEVRRRAEFHVAAVTDVAVTVQPRPHHQAVAALVHGAEAEVVVQRGADVSVVPAGHEQNRHVRDPRVEALGVDAQLLPVAVEVAALPLFEQVVLVLGQVPQRRVTAAPGHPREPGVDVLRFQGRAQRRVGLGRRAFLGLPEGPGGLLQLERPALADAALVGVGEAPGVQHHGAQPGRGEAGHRQLGMGRIGQPHAAHPAVAPGLLDDPGQAVVAVLPLVDVLDEVPFRAMPPATVLEHRGEAPFGELQGHVLARQVAAVQAPFRARGLALVVRRALDHHRPGACANGGQIDVGGQAHAVAHPDHAVLEYLHG